MTKRNPYLQHTYESFDQPVTPRRPQQSESFSERMSNSEFAAKLRSPVVATAALLMTGAALAGIIIASYPDSKQPDDNLPVISADASPLRESPVEPGGLDVAHDDSTIYGSIRSAELQETPPLENLLAEEQPVDTQTALAAAPLAALDPAAGALQPASVPGTSAEQAEDTLPPSEMADATAGIEKPGIPDLKVSETRSIPMKSEKIALAPSGETAAKPEIAPAGSTPETLAYVRSALDEAKPVELAKAEPSADAVAAIEPAAGASTMAGAAIKPGSSYVQLASISSEAAAPKEWSKLQKQFSSLSGAEYRVQRADLGAKGVFYRIQAGPMSKDSAKSVCDSIKATKPGGCIIVQ